MQSEEKTILQRVVENFARTGNASDEQVTVVSLPFNDSHRLETLRGPSASSKTIRNRV